MRGPHFSSVRYAFTRAECATRRLHNITRSWWSDIRGFSFFFLSFSLLHIHLFGCHGICVGSFTRWDFFFLSIAVPAHGRHARTGPSVAVALAVLSLSLFLSLSQLTDWLQIVIIECVYAYEWANLDHFSVWNGESLRRRSRCINQSSSPLCACQGGDGVWVKYLIHFGISLLRDDRSTTFTVRWISIVGPTEKN